MSHRLPSLALLALEQPGGWEDWGVVDKLILKLLVGSLRSGSGMNGYCQNLLVGPLQRVDGVGVWITRLTATAELHFEGESNVLGLSLLGKKVPLLMETPVTQAVRTRQFCYVNKLPQEWVNGHQLPSGLVYSAFPIQQDLLIRGAMMLAHSGKKEAREFVEEVFELLEALTSLSFDLSRQESGRRTSGEHAGAQIELTSRQLAVLNGIRDGLTNYQIARILNVSESTVKQESIRIYKHLDVNNRADAVAVALEQGLIQEQTLEAETTPPLPKSSQLVGGR